MKDTHITESQLTEELLDRFPVIRATAGDGQYAEFRPDRRLARMYAAEAPAEVQDIPPTLWVRVPDARRRAPQAAFQTAS